MIRKYFQIQLAVVDIRRPQILRSILFPEGYSQLCLERQYLFPEGNISFLEGHYLTLRRLYELPDPAHGVFCNAVLHTESLGHQGCLSYISAVPGKISS